MWILTFTIRNTNWINNYSILVHKSTVNEYNDFNGNLINNIFRISVLNTITGTVESEAKIILLILNYKKIVHIQCG